MGCFLTVTKRCLLWIKITEKLQRNVHNEKCRTHLSRSVVYLMRSTPQKWKSDCFYTKEKTIWIMKHLTDYKTLFFSQYTYICNSLQYFGKTAIFRTKQLLNIQYFESSIYTNQAAYLVRPYFREKDKSNRSSVWSFVGVLPVVYLF